MITGTIQVERNWDLPVPQDVKSVIAYYTGRILNELNLSNMFADLYPIVRDYIQRTGATRMQLIQRILYL
ncbi:MAG: hypothetical protein BJBARM5_1056 [Candidatus Parvarchaeum acidophilus ARMAN-5]|uniref:Uncharacterized protein n=1 Tax=Candidatus Parvarchaeum acidophilus ARMAN-5 TaxID=662762 RepID=D6GX32_PARA5|nr:MAG: hypothetical protein BJBARM5_1056 [Candidatus Parvarchaeum acidophilus ARMAN-5]